MKRVVLTVTYNERGNIAALVEAVRAFGYDMLVVDDQGTDDTAGLVREMAARDSGVHLIARDAKLGYASAVRDGMRWALEHGYEQIAQLDADGSHQPARLPVLFRALDEADWAIGSRYVFGGRMPGLSPIRRLTSRAAGWYLRRALALPVADPTSGYRAWRADFLARVLRGAGVAEGFAFLYETAFLAVRAGGRCGEIPITFETRGAGQSKMSWAIVRDAIRVVRQLRAGRQRSMRSTPNYL